MSLINRAFAYISIILRVAPSRGRDPLGKKSGCLVYKAVGRAIAWNYLILPIFVQPCDV